MVWFEITNYELATDVSIGEDEATFDPKTSTGSVWIHFQEEAHYGCKDMNDFPYHDEETLFEADPKSLTMTSYFKNEPERTPDEYSPREI